MVSEMSDSEVTEDGTPCRPQLNKCAFLLEEEEEKLSTTVINYLALGQYELARANLRLLHDKNPQRAVTILKQLFQDPPKHWLCSASVPSPAHLVWLSFFEYDALGPQEAATQKSQHKQSMLKRLEFELLISQWDHEKPPRFTEDVISELRRIRFATRRTVRPAPGLLDITSPQKDVAYVEDDDLRLSDVSYHQLRSYVLETPLLGYALLRQLSTNETKAVSERLQGLYLDIGRELVTEGQYSQLLTLFAHLSIREDRRLVPLQDLFSMVLELFSTQTTLLNDTRRTMDDDGVSDVSGDSEGTRSEDIDDENGGGSVGRGEEPGLEGDEEADIMDDVSGSEGDGQIRHEPDGDNKRLREKLCADFLTEGNDDLSRDVIYEALLASDERYPLRLFCLLEDDFIRATWEKKRLPVILHALQLPIDEEVRSKVTARFWREYFAFLRVSGGHCVEYLLEKGLRLVRERKFDDAGSYLTPADALKPLLALMCWDDFEGEVRCREKLMNVLYHAERANKAEVSVEGVCQQLAYNLKLALWSSKQKWPAGSSVLATQANCGKQGRHKRDIIADEILRELKTHSIPFVLQDLFAGCENATEILSVLESRPVSSELTSAQKELDMVITNGYFALRHLARLFLMAKNGDININSIKVVAEEARNHIRSISFVSCRIRVLENAFNMLFLKREQWKVVSEDEDPDLAAATSSTAAGETPRDPSAGPHGPEDGQGSVFIANSVMASSILTLLRESLDEVFDALDIDNDDTSILLTRAKTLQARVHGAEWRLRVLYHVSIDGDLHSGRDRGDSATSITTIPGGEKYFENDVFMPRMLASAESMINMCLKIRDYDYCKIVTQFFQIPESQSAHVSLAELLDSTRKMMSSNPREVSHHNDLEKALSQTAPLQAFYILGDLAICSAFSPDGSKQLLRNAEQYLEQSKQEQYNYDSRSMLVPAANLPKNTAEALKNRLFDLVRRLYDLLKDEKYAERPLNSLITSIEAHPTVYVTPQLAVLDALFALSASNAQKDQVGREVYAHMDSFCKLIVSSFADDSSNVRGRGSKGEGNDSRNPGLTTIDETSYLARFLQYLLSVAEIIYPCDLPRTFDYYSLVESNPYHFVTHLVFEAKLYGPASLLAKLIDANILSIILAACDQETCAENESEGGDATFVDDVPKPRVAAAAYSKDVPPLYGEGSRQYHLTMDATRFMHSINPTIATLAAAFRHPKHIMDGEFLSYALVNSPLESPVHRWIQSRVRIHQKYAEIFLRQSLSFPQEHDGDATTSPYETFQVERSVGHGDDGCLDTRAFDCANACDGSKDISFFTAAIEKLCVEGKYEDALGLIDERGSAVEDGTMDTVLQSVIDRMENKSHASPLIHRLGNKSLAASFILEYLESWDVDTCVDLLYMCSLNLPANHPSKTRVDELYTRMSLFQIIMRVDSTWVLWQDLAEAGEDCPDKVISGLVQLRQYDLARKVMAFFDLNHFKNEIEAEYLVDLLTRKNDVCQAQLILVSFGESSVPICRLILEKVQSYSVKLFIVQYMLNKMKNFLSHDEWSKLATQRLGLEAIIRLPEPMHPNLCHLIDFPNLIVESLLMGQHTALVSKLFSDLTALHNDDLVITYAKKALVSISNATPIDDPDVTEISQLSSNFNTSIVNVSTGQLSNLSAPTGLPPGNGSAGASAVWLDDPNQDDTVMLAENEIRQALTGDIETDNALRYKHSFRQAPSFNLCRAFLELCTDYRMAGQACLTMVDVLCKLLYHISFERKSAVLVPDLIRPLLVYAKSQFLKGADSTGGLVLCNTYLSHVQLMESIPLPVTLADLSDPDKARSIRDKLVVEDYNRLALDLCERCGVEAEPVWKAWGVSLLKLGLYDSAKQKLAHCLVPPEYGGDPCAPASRDLMTVLSVLEGLPPLQLDAIRALPQQLEESRLGQSQTEPNAYLQSLQSNARAPVFKLRGDSEKIHSSSNLDTQRYEVCLYFLKTYGTHRALVAFWMRHGKMQEACNYVFTAALPPRLFVEEVVSKCISNAELPRLAQAIRSQSMSIDSIYDYMLGLCKCLAQRRSYHHLYDFQVVMGDDARAGLTCINLFKVVIDVAVRLEHLARARKHFMAAIASLQRRENNAGTGENGDTSSRRSTRPVLSENDLAENIKAVTLQMEVTNFLSSENKHKEYLNLSLFEDDEHRSKFHIVEVLLPINFDLAYRVANEFQLPLVPLYIHVCANLAKASVPTKIMELLDHAKDTISSHEWDTILTAVITTFCVESEEFKTAEKFVTRLVNNEAKVNAYIMCRKLKLALQLVVDIGRVEYIETIREEAVRHGHKSVISSCDKFTMLMAQEAAQTGTGTPSKR